MKIESGSSGVQERFQKLWNFLWFKELKLAIVIVYWLWSVLVRIFLSIAITIISVHTMTIIIVKGWVGSKSPQLFSVKKINVNLAYLTMVSISFFIQTVLTFTFGHCPEVGGNYPCLNFWSFFGPSLNSLITLLKRLQSLCWAWS